jgi:hypothetical protein
VTDVPFLFSIAFCNFLGKISRIMGLAIRSKTNVKNGLINHQIVN